MMRRIDDQIRPRALRNRLEIQMRHAIYGRRVEHPLSCITATDEGDRLAGLQSNICQIVQLAVDFIQLAGTVREYHRGIALRVHGILRVARIAVPAGFH